MEEKKETSKEEYLTKIISIAQKMTPKQTEHAFYVLKGMQINGVSQEKGSKKN